MAGALLRAAARDAVLTRLLVTVGVVAALLLPAAPAVGERCIKVDPVTGKCLIAVPDPGDPGNPGGPGDPGPPGGGGGDPCGYELVQPQPPASDPIWGAATPEKADVYWKYCPGAAPVQVVLGAGIGALPPPMDPAVLADMIIAEMTFFAPTIATAPPQGSDGGLVGLPQWYWVVPSPTTTGPLSDSDAQGGVSVSVSGVVTQITWDMGDGNSIVCGLGTPYPGGGFDGESPDCGYTYELASSNHVPGGGPWPISATSTWTIYWSGGGEAGTEVIELTTEGEMMIRELYVLNQSGGG